ncbi:hypothetical protein [Fodinibius salsisoli]|uniref:Uncharacterized protein n=1 Tax=Fodinibius salsisoli TaxID=2820877 RepID=A0ABT3PR10_9BACT|nr:hypothetical protein [Fodinibius salsisoli]MCW9708295.1 hypothetical protein [Fodinibius salsisoli]
MSQKEIYAWSSLVSSIVLLTFYLVSVFGWPEGMAGYDFIMNLFWKILGIAVAVEVVLALLKEFNAGEDQDDDEQVLIESKSYRNAYYLLMGALVTLMVHIFINEAASEFAGKEMWLTVPFMTLHLLVIIVFTASITKSTTQLYYYIKR